MSSRSIKDQTNNFGVWNVHDSSRWHTGRDFNIVLSNSESPGRAMRMSTGVTQNLRQGTATELNTTVNIRHSQLKILENIQRTETWIRDRVISSNESFRQRSAKSMSTTDVKTEFLNMEIVHQSIISRKDENYLLPRSPRPRSLSSTMKTVIHLGLTNEKNMEIRKYRNFENIENSFTVTENLKMENYTEILNKSKNDSRFSSLSQEVIKDKGTRLLGLSSMSWENDLFKGRDKRKMDHPSGTVQDVLRSSRFLWIRWRSYWLGVENFPD